MFRLYLKILALNIGLSNFIVLTVAYTNGGAVKSADFFFPAAIQFLVVTVIFVMLDLVKTHAHRAPEEIHQAQPALRIGSIADPATRRGFYVSRTVSAGFAPARQNSIKGHSIKGQ